MAVQYVVSAVLRVPSFFLVNPYFHLNISFISRFPYSSPCCVSRLQLDLFVFMQLVSLNCIEASIFVSFYACPGMVDVCVFALLFLFRISTVSTSLCGVLIKSQVHLSLFLHNFISICFVMRLLLVFVYIDTWISELNG